MANRKAMDPNTITDEDVFNILPGEVDLFADPTLMRNEPGRVAAREGDNFLGTGVSRKEFFDDMFLIGNKGLDALREKKFKELRPPTVENLSNLIDSANRLSLNKTERIKLKRAEEQLQLMLESPTKERKHFYEETLDKVQDELYKRGATTLPSGKTSVPRSKKKKPGSSMIGEGWKSVFGVKEMTNKELLAEEAMAKRGVNYLKKKKY